MTHMSFHWHYRTTNAHAKETDLEETHVNFKGLILGK